MQSLSSTMKFESAAYIKSMIVLEGRYLACGHNDGQLTLWDLNKRAEIKRVQAHDGPIDALKVLPNGTLATVANHRDIKVFNLLQTDPEASC